MYAYLAGAMEHAPDFGAKWRKEMSKFLIDELGHQVFNPCIEQEHVLTEEERQLFRTWKANNLNRFRATVHKIIQKDLNTILTKSDYLICLWDEYVLSGGGTQGELTMAHYNKIPVYMVSKIRASEISSWILGCTTELFPDFDSLKQFLRKEFAAK